MAEWVGAAREYVRRATGLEIDGSVESLAYADHYLAGVGEVDDPVLALLAAALGAYFGEVAIADLGGRWEVAGEPAEWTVSLSATPVRFRPAALAAEAIRRRSTPGYDASIDVPPELQAALSRALESAGPVEEEYYHSLTGRLETLSHVAALIAELGRPGSSRVS